MGLFSKIFGAPEPEPELPVIPEEATSRDIIAIALDSTIKQVGGTCATLELPSEPGKWLQIMDSSINAHYPHQESPDSLFPELYNHPIVAGLEGYETEVYMTISLNNMNEPEVTAWIDSYFSKVLSVDLNNGRLSLRMEDI